MAVNVSVHDVTKVEVQKTTLTRENGERWFVTKEIIVTDDSDKEVLKVTLFADDVEEILFNEKDEEVL